MSEVWCVYHLIHVQTPHKYIPQLVIRDVPTGEEITTEMLARAGFEYGEFGIPWANHSLEEVDPGKSPASLVAAIRQGEGKTITYQELVERANAPL